MRVYRVRIKQHNSQGFQQMDETVDVRAFTAFEAIKRAQKHMRSQVLYLRSRPLETTSVDEIVSNLL